MAAQSPSTRETNRISPEVALPTFWASAEACAKIGVEPTETCIRESPRAGAVAVASRVNATRPAWRENFMGESVAAQEGGINFFIW